MPIREYKSKTGETLWKVAVCVRSKEVTGLRIQKAKFKCTSESEALREEASLTRLCQQELAKEEAKGSLWGTIVDAWEAYLKEQGDAHLAETTRIDYVAAIRTYTSEWKFRPAISINRLQVRNCLVQLRQKGGSQGFQKRMKGLINQVFVFGIESGMIRGMERSPVFGVALDRPEEKKPEILTTAEIRKLLSEALRLDYPWYPIWAMALLTGMRNGELFALLWSDVNWENKSISINKSYNSRLKRVTGTKAGYWRAVPISTELRNLLLELKANAGDRTHVLPRYPLWSSGLQAEQLRQFCVAVGLPSIRFHALRACFATQLIQYGTAPIMVQKICGWRDLKTMQRYIRMAGIEIQGATDCLKMLPETEAEISEKVVGLFTGSSS